MSEPNASIAEKVPGPKQEEVAVLAYFIWISEGRPEGRQDANWDDAERQLRESFSSGDGADRSEATPKINEQE